MVLKFDFMRAPLVELVRVLSLNCGVGQLSCFERRFDGKGISEMRKVEMRRE